MADSENKYDFSHLSDSQLDARIAEKQKALQPKYDFSHLSDDEIDKRIADKLKAPTLADKIVGDVMSGVEVVGNTVNRFGAAPTRAALSELTSSTPRAGQNPEDSQILGNIKAAGSAFYNQFGANPDLAPTGKEIAANNFGISAVPGKPLPFYKFKSELSSADLKQIAREGIKPDVHGRYQLGTQENASPAGVVGGAIDVLADPLNLIPGETIAKGLGKGTGIVLKNSAKALEAIPGIKTTKSVIEDAGKSLERFIKPTQAEDFKSLADVAAKNGIDIANAPEAIEFGKNSLISRGSRVQAEGTLGQSKLDRHAAFLQETTNAFENKLKDVSGGEILDRVSAGNHLAQSYDRAVDTLFNEASNGYSDLIKTYPGLQLSEDAKTALDSKLNGIEKFAKGRISRGLSSSQEQQGGRLLKAVEAIRATNGSVKQAVETLRDLGEIGYKSENFAAAIPPDIKRTRELYSALRDGILDTVKTDVKDGQAVAGAIQISNDLMSKFFKQTDGIANIIKDSSKAPEQIFDRVLKTSSQVESLKAILSPEDFAKLKGAYLESLLKRDEYGAISFPSLQTALKSKTNKEVVTRLFSPEELKDLADIAHLGNRAGIPIMSTAGSAPGLSLKKIAEEIPNAILNENVLAKMKTSARNRGLAVPIQEKPSASLFGPQAISLREALGLRLPQQYSNQQRNNRGK